MAKATAANLTSILALIPTFSDLNPLERRGMLKLKARETRRSLEYELRLLEGMRDRQDTDAQREDVIDSYDSLHRAAMLVFKGERDPGFYFVDSKARVCTNPDSNFQSLAKELLATAYSLREWGVFTESTMEDVILDTLKKGCCCLQAHPEYAPAIPRVPVKDKSVGA